MTHIKMQTPFIKSIDSLLNDVFNELPTQFSKTVRENVLQNPPVNIIEKEHSYVINLMAAGFEKENFDIKLENSLLTISGTAKVLNDETTSNVKLKRKEFSINDFKRIFTLDKKIETSNIVAEYQNGILIIHLAKKEETPAEVQKISIS